MPKFQFRLATLLRLRESARDERRQQLGQAYRAEELVRREEERLAGELAGLRDAARRVGGPGAIDVDRLLETQRYEMLVRAQQQHVAGQRQAVRAEVERRRQALVEANREVDVLEKLRQRQFERFRDEENRQDIRRLDEAGQMRVLREDE